ncbi:MAG: M48 family metalloprotease [Bryobacteraceae bacterium]
MRLKSLVAALILCGNLLAQQRELKPGFNLFSKQQDIQLGREAAAQIEQEVRVVNHPELNEYIRRIGTKLAAQQGADEYPYSFKVVDDKNINAFALPGGPTYVNTGLIIAADNEAQLAGVMAHEIAHVALRHGTNQVSRANLIQLPALLGASLAGNQSITGMLAQLGIGLGANSLLMKYSRNAERDADLLGARLMSAAGYNPIEAARFFEKLEAQGGSRGLEFLSSHPNPGNRSRMIQEEIRYLPQRQYDGETGQFQRMKQIAAQATGAPAPKQQPAAATSANPRQMRPSGRLQRFQGSNFIMSHPDNWRVHTGSNAQSVTIAPPEALHTSPNGTMVGYGVLAGFQQSRGGSVDLPRDTNTLIQQMRQSNPGMGDPSRSRRVRVDNQNALVTTLRSRSPYEGETEIDMLVTVARPGGLFYLIFIAPESEYRLAQGTYEQMLRSVRFR